MKKGKALAFIITLCMILNLVAVYAAPEKEEYAFTTSAYGTGYTIGEVLEGSYQGYAHIEIPRFFSQAEMTAAGYDIKAGTVTFDAQGRPVLTEKNANFFYYFPEVDSNGNPIPSGNGSESYGIYRYSLNSKRDSQAFVAAANATSTRHNTPINSGNVEISKLGSDGNEQFIKLDLTGYSEVDANDVVMFKVLQTPSGGKGRYTSWFLNETKDEGKPPIGSSQLQDYETRWGAANTNLSQVKVALGGNTVGGMTFHGAEVYERAEYVLRYAIKEAEKVLLGANDSMDNILENLNFTQEVAEPGFDNKVYITWSSENENVIANDGTVTIPAASAERVRVVATYSYGDKQKHIAYDFVVVGGMDDETIVQWAADNLTWESLTQQHQSRVVDGFNLPSSRSVFGTYVSVAWQVVEGFEAAQIVGGRLEPVRGQADANVTIKATLSYNGVVCEKTFEFTVAKEEIVINYVNDDYSQSPSGEITDANIQIKAAGTSSSYTRYESGKGIRAYGANPSSGNSNAAGAIVKIANKVADVGLLEAYNNFESNVVYEFTVAYEADSTSVESETFVKLLDGKGSMITFLQMRGARKGTEAAAATINIKQNNAWTDGISVIQPFIVGKYRAGYSGGRLPEVTYRIVYNRMTCAYDVYIKLASEPDSEYVLFFKGALPTESVEKGSVVDAIEIGASTNASRSGAITLRNLKVYTTENIIADYIMENMSAGLILNGQNPASVTKALTVRSPHYGFDFMLEVQSDYNGELISPLTGQLAQGLKGTDAYNARITPKAIGKTLMLGSMVVTGEPFDIVVRGFDSDSIIFGKAISVIGATAQSGEASFINDGISATAFITNGQEGSFSIMVDIGGSVLFNKFIINEGKVGQSFNIGNWSIEVSANRRNWISVAQGSKVEGVKNIVLPSPYEKYRYVRLNVEDKINPSASVAINEFAVYFEPDEAYKSKQDFDALTKPPSSASSDFYVQGIGSVYGTLFTWTSANTDILRIGNLITDSSSQYYGMYKVSYSKPDKSSYVTLKATAGGESKTFSIYIPVGSSGGGAGAGGGTGGGGYKGTGSGVIGTLGDVAPKAPEDINEASPSKYFGDMNEAPWAAKYVDALKDAGVISGDAEGRFNPNRHITRAEFVKMVISSLGIDTSFKEDLPFADVTEDMWFYEYAGAAYRAGIISGVSEDLFAPNDAITRQDIAVILSRVAEIFEITFDEADSVNDFADIDLLDGYAVEAVRKIQRYGIVSGDSGGRFNGKSFATRAETAKMIYPFVTGSVE